MPAQHRFRHRLDRAAILRPQLSGPAPGILRPEPMHDPTEAVVAALQGHTRFYASLARRTVAEGRRPAEAQDVVVELALAATRLFAPIARRDGEPVRQAAGIWGVNLNTVARAYSTLAERGILETRAGGGTFVARTPSDGAVDGLGPIRRARAARSRS